MEEREDCLVGIEFTCSAWPYEVVGAHEQVGDYGLIYDSSRNLRSDGVDVVGNSAPRNVGTVSAARLCDLPEVSVHRQLRLLVFLLGLAVGLFLFHILILFQSFFLLALLTSVNTHTET